MKKKYLIIDCFGEDWGHHVNYNQFLVDLLGEHVDLSICCSKKLAGVIYGQVRKLPIVHHIAKRPILLRLGVAFSLMFLRLKPYDSVFFSAFEEITLSLWRRSAMGKVSILITNNLKNLNQNSIKFKLLRRIFRNVKTILVHNAYQKDYVVTRFGVSGRKVIVIPHYAAGYDRGVSSQDIMAREEIVFLGGTRGDKGLDHFINLISADDSGRNNYGIYGDVNLSPQQIELLAAKQVTMVQKYLTKDEYFQILKRSKFVVLFYNRSFETRISGIYFDAVSCLTPVIASNIKSFTSYFEKFGRIGELVDLSDPLWKENLLSKGFASDYSVYLSALKRMQQKCSHSILMDVYQLL